MAEISLRNVSKSFGAVHVIEDVSLTIANREFVVFLGPSGSGKSTLLRMIAGLESVDGGEITIGGRRGRRAAAGAARRGDGVPELRPLPAHERAREHGLRAAQHPHGGRRDRASGSREAARILEIGQLLDRRPSQLSGGQRQRVAIGRAIVKEPKAFLFDEPLSNLDAALRVRTRVELAELHQRMAPR